MKDENVTEIEETKAEKPVKVKTPLTKRERIKMAVTWAVSFVLLLAVGFGTTAGILASIPKRFALSIDKSKVIAVTYLNENSHASGNQKIQGEGRLLMPASDQTQAGVVTDIITALNKSMKTNRLAHMFRGSPDDAVETNVSGSKAPYRESFLSNYNANGIIIDFLDAQFHVVKHESPTVTYEIVAGASEVNPIYSIWIPLDKHENKFQEQTWYFYDKPKMNQSGATLPFRMKTYGNYYALWEKYVSTYDLP